MSAFVNLVEENGEWEASGEDWISPSDNAFANDLLVLFDVVSCRAIQSRECEDVVWS